MCHISHDWDKVFKGSDRLPKSALARMAISNNKSVAQCRAKGIWTLEIKERVWEIKSEAYQVSIGI